MSSYTRPAAGTPLVPLVLLGSLLAFSAALVAGSAVTPAAAGVIMVAVVAAGSRFLSRWHVMVGAIGLIIMFIPIKRYEFAGVELPFDLEPYRVAVAIVIALWIGSLLIEPNVVLRRSGLEAPLLVFGLAVIGSIVTNVGGITAGDLAGNVTKELLFLASFFLVFYFVVSVVRTPTAIHNVLKTLVFGAAVVAALAIFERRTQRNLFNELGDLIPLLDFRGEIEEEKISRAGRLRTYASAQHPIALAGMFVVMFPLALYLARYTRRWWWAGAAVLIAFGALATVSRTSITMFAAVAAVFLWLKPRDLKRLLPLLLPAAVAVHLALPGVIGGIRQSFFPPQGLIADQTEYGGRISSRRLKPQFEIIGGQPAFGQGYGTRITAGEGVNARILDNQWLGTTVETGLVGLLAWIWIFGRFLRRTGREAKEDTSARGWLLASVAASGGAFAVGMFTYDAFSFIQVTLILFMVLALGASTLSWRGSWPSEQTTPRPG